jgi:hypothetical protein
MDKGGMTKISNSPLFLVSYPPACYSFDQGLCFPRSTIPQSPEGNGFSRMTL